MPRDPDIIVRRISQPASRVLTWARSATKHRITHEQSRYVIEHCGLCFREAPSISAPDDADSRLVYLGDDAHGSALEVMAVELTHEHMLVIHAMFLRERYRDMYEEAKGWRR
jgi:hypothetical protein